MPYRRRRAPSSRPLLEWQSLVVHPSQIPAGCWVLVADESLSKAGRDGDASAVYEPCDQYRCGATVALTTLMEAPVRGASVPKSGGPRYNPKLGLGNLVALLERLGSRNLRARPIRCMEPVWRPAQSANSTRLT